MTDAFDLAEPPTDGISRVKFSPGGNFLMATSWDKTTRLYDVDRNQMRSKFTSSAPVLTCCFSEATKGYSGGLASTVVMHDFNTDKESAVGQHEDAVRCLEYSSTHNILLSGSWDKNISLWDPRAEKALVSSHEQPDKVYAMSCVGDTVVVATAGRHIWIWDLRNMSAVAQRRESSLKYQTRALATMPDGQGYVVGSIEGRVAVEYFDPSPESQKRKFAFKCHRVKADGVNQIYPVNSIAFHSGYGTFATAGADGIVNTWDGANRKRLYSFHKMDTGIASVDFNAAGNLLAIAVSYSYEEGEKEHPADTIHIRPITDAEVKPKHLP